MNLQDSVRMTTFKVIERVANEQQRRNVVTLNSIGWSPALIERIVVATDGCALVEIFVAGVSGGEALMDDPDSANVDLDIMTALNGKKYDAMTQAMFVVHEAQRGESE